MGHANRVLALYACCQLRGTAKWSIEAYGPLLVEVRGASAKHAICVFGLNAPAGGCGHCVQQSGLCGCGSACCVGEWPMEAFRSLRMCDRVQQWGMLFVSLIFVPSGGDRRSVQQNGLRRFFLALAYW